MIVMLLLIMLKTRLVKLRVIPLIVLFVRVQILLRVGVVRRVSKRRLLILLRVKRLLLSRILPRSWAWRFPRFLVLLLMVKLRP